MVCVLQLDIATAFDTIPHQAIKPALIKHGIPLRVASAVLRSYTSVSTSIKCKEENINVNLHAALKPHQKLLLLTTYLIPHFLYSAALSLPSATTIRTANSLIRNTGKQIVIDHLNM
jgi:hypothetical protein